VRRAGPGPHLVDCRRWLQHASRSPARNLRRRGDRCERGAGYELCRRLFNNSIGGITARPPGSVGNFLSVGTSGGQSGPIIVDLAVAPADYYGFLWGSPDRYNSVEFYDDETLLKSLSGADVFANPNPANGFQGAFSNGQYFNAFAGNAEQITRVVFRSTGNAFETDNHAVMAVPEPGSYALMLAGLGVMGFVAKRRKTG